MSACTTQRPLLNHKWVVDNSPICKRSKGLCVVHADIHVLHTAFSPLLYSMSGDCLHEPNHVCIVIIPLGKSSTIQDMVTYSQSAVHSADCSQKTCQCLQAYAIPAYQFDIKLCKTNRPPHSAVRAPGKFESPLIMEHIIEHVAARLNLDPVAVRELNFLKAPPSGACFRKEKKRKGGEKRKRKEKNEKKRLD